MSPEVRRVRGSLELCSLLYGIPIFPGNRQRFPAKSITIKLVVSGISAQNMRKERRVNLIENVTPHSLGEIRTSAEVRTLAVVRQRRPEQFGSGKCQLRYD